MIPFLELLHMTSQIIYLYSIQLMPKKQSMNQDIRHTHETLQNAVWMTLFAKSHKKIG